MEGNKKEKFKIKEEVYNKIIRITEDCLEGFSPEDKKDLLLKIEAVIDSWLNIEFELWEEYSNEELVWDDYDSMKFALEDLPKAWYNSLASQLGLESYDEKRKREYEEYEAARSKVEVKKENCDDGLPF